MYSTVKQNFIFSSIITENK